MEVNFWSAYSGTANYRVSYICSTINKIAVLTQQAVCASVLFT